MLIKQHLSNKYDNQCRTIVILRLCVPDSIKWCQNVREPVAAVVAQPDNGDSAWEAEILARRRTVVLEW